MKQQYPKFLQRPDGTAVVAKDIDAHARLTEKGFLTADEFDALKASTPLDPVPPLEPAPPSAPPVAGEETGPVEQRFEALSAVDAVARITETSDAAVLAEWRDEEENRPAPRKTVLRALADRRAALTATSRTGEASPAAEAQP